MGGKSCLSEAQRRSIHECNNDGLGSLTTKGQFCLCSKEGQGNKLSTLGKLKAGEQSLDLLRLLGEVLHNLDTAESFCVNLLLALAFALRDSTPGPWAAVLDDGKVRTDVTPGPEKASTTFLAVWIWALKPSLPVLGHSSINKVTSMVVLHASTLRPSINMHRCMLHALYSKRASSQSPAHSPEPSAGEVMNF